MHRFFISPECFDRDNVIITGEQVHQLKDVLRLKPGDQIVVLDNSGAEYEIRLVDINTNRVTGEVVAQGLASGEPRVEITLYQALLKGNRFDVALQKCTEIGVARFVPVLCERCVARNPGESRLDRWQKIIVEAAEQSRRGKIPFLEPLIEFRQVCERVSGIFLLPWEEESNLGIRSAMCEIGKIDHLNIFIGPEGGFTSNEAEFARLQGITPVTLGKRLLRAETAGLVTVAAILYEYDELG